MTSGNHSGTIINWLGYGGATMYAREDGFRELCMQSTSITLLDYSRSLVVNGGRSLGSGEHDLSISMGK
jgi:hypothetical protein